MDDLPDLNLLRVFDALFAERHLTRAARRLGLSQSATSAALSRLRRSLGDELFVRSVSGMAPTPRAEALAVPVAEALRQISLAWGGESAVDLASLKRVITIGMTDHVSQVLLPPLLSELERHAPQVDLRIRAVWVRSLQQALDAGEVHLAIGAVPKLPTRFVTRRLLLESFMGLQSAGYPPIRDAQDYADRPHLLVHVEGDTTGPVDRALALQGLQRRISLTVPRFGDVAPVVERSRIIATVPRLIAMQAAQRYGVAVFEPPLPLKDFAVDLVWHRRAEHDAALLWFRDLVVRTTNRIIDS